MGLNLESVGAQFPTGIDVDNKTTISSTTWTAPSNGIIILYSTDNDNNMYQKDSTGEWITIARAARGPYGWNEIQVAVFTRTEYKFKYPNAVFFPYKYD